PAAIRLEDAGDKIQERRLARAALAPQGELLTRGELKRRHIHDLDPLPFGGNERFFQIGHGQHRSDKSPQSRKRRKTRILFLRFLRFFVPFTSAVSSLPSPGRRFRAALDAERPLQIAGAINAYAALLAQRAGFRALYLSGAGVANHS